VILTSKEEDCYMELDGAMLNSKWLQIIRQTKPAMTGASRCQRFTIPLIYQAINFTRFSRG